jgi:DNA-binding transcriptional MerR regulator
MHLKLHVEGEGPAGRRLRPVDLGRAIGQTAEMARRYERWGYLPPANRIAAGRRLYGPRHLHAILAAREMRAGFGSKAAPRAMQRLHQGDLAGALTLVDERHAALHRRRLEVEETLRLLQALADGLPARMDARGGAEAVAVRPRRRGSVATLRIGDAARRVGMRMSAVRFWEAQGLLHPPRDEASGYRVFDVEQMLRLKWWQCCAVPGTGSTPSPRSSTNSRAGGPAQR